MSKKEKEEVNIDRSVTNYERQFYGRNAEIIYCGGRMCEMRRMIRVHGYDGNELVVEWEWEYTDQRDNARRRRWLIFDPCPGITATRTGLLGFHGRFHGGFGSDPSIISCLPDFAMTRTVPPSPVPAPFSYCHLSLPYSTTRLNSCFLSHKLSEPPITWTSPLP
jgi:hypothetical protein